MTLVNFQENLRKYAKILVTYGINVQPGQTVALSIDVEQAELARLIVKEAYALGAHEVIVLWTDEQIQYQQLLHNQLDRLENAPDYKVSEFHYLLDKKASYLLIPSSHPEAFQNISPDRVAKAAEVYAKISQPLMMAAQSKQICWTMAAAAGKAWAQKIFPKAKDEEEATDLLWDQIFKSCKVYEDDPAAAWIAHREKLNAKAQILNQAQFTALHYLAPGTDLTVGMPKNHRWDVVGGFDEQGNYCIANMPTEEIYSAPDFRRADGYVSSTKPLNLNGQLIEGIHLVFKNGQIVEATAEKGEQAIKNLIFQHDGARHLGEVALVPDSSPISQSGITFFHTLFDENASNHLAIGSAYPISLVGGENYSEEELKAAGLNRSSVHVDFMIGSNQMDIDGICPDGSRVPIFRKGEWAI